MNQYDDPTGNPLDAFSQAIENASAFQNPEPGNYTALVLQVKARPVSEKGQSMQVTYLFYDEDAMEGEPLGKRYTQFFQILKEDRRTPAGGAGFFKTFMAKLGYGKGHFGNPQSWEEINKENPAVIIKVTPSSTEGYVNYAIQQYIEPENETEEIINLRSWLADNPF